MEEVEVDALLSGAQAVIGDQSSLDVGWRQSSFVDTTEYWDPPTDHNQKSPWDTRLAMISTQVRQSSSPFQHRVYSPLTPWGGHASPLLTLYHRRMSLLRPSG